MLSPITPCIFSSVENIPSLDIFAPSDNISQPGPCWPTETATGASPVANFQAAADPDTSQYPEQVKPTRERKKTACETDLELSLESGVEAQQPVTRKRSLLEGLEPPCPVKFDRILDDEDTSEANTAQFLGKRDIADFDNRLLHLSPQISRLNNHDEHSKGMLLETEQADSKKQCKMGHKMGQASQKHRECTLCKSVLGTIERFVQERNGHLVSKELDHEVVLCCENGHQWTVGYKKATKSWCKDCKSKRKQLLKEMIEEEKARIFQERRMKQEKLFEEARQHIINSKETQKQETKAELDNTKIIMDEITRIASKYAREYCQKEASAEFEQSLLLYQTLILPEKVLTTYFSSLSKVGLKSEIRRYTILLHPDKNSHPKAKQAFQKAYGLMSRQLETL